MKTVLIVEDEKMIRQGIKTMIMRSGVPVEVIMECNNGETALEVLKEQKIDVMFTDIRMPKMDGITLVQEMQKCEHIPLTVAISGYDDFSYAVEMMRNGVKEYILKPIQRDKIKEILEKLNKEIEYGKEKDETIQKLGIQQMKYLMQNEKTSEEELMTIKKQYESNFMTNQYYVCIVNAMPHKVEEENYYIFVNDEVDGDIYIVEEEKLEYLIRNELQNGSAGISGLHSGIEQLHQAYEEAMKMRKEAFCRGEKLVCFGYEEKKIPKGLRAEALKLTKEAASLQRIQLLGTKKTEEIEKVFKRFFYEVVNGRISPEEYEQCMNHFFDEISKTYRNILQNREDEIEQLRIYWEKDNIKSYESVFLAFVMNLHKDINSRLDVNKNQKKIQDAVDYIDKNYAEDLNMAVVSNYISMNYSLFSFLFKQYTGSNFVNYLKNIRMEKAKELLEKTDLRIIEISHRIGYENEKHFMKIFKTTCGVSPSEYRKNLQMKE